MGKNTHLTLIIQIKPKNSSDMDPTGCIACKNQCNEHNFLFSKNIYSIHHLTKIFT